MAQSPSVQLPGRLLAVEVAATAGAAAADTTSAQELARRVEQQRQQMQRELAGDKAHLAAACQALHAAAEELNKLRADMLAEAEGQLLDLALEIARKVLMQEIQAGRYEIEPIVAEALRHVPPRCDVVVHLHPEDHARCETASADEPGAESGSVRLVADPNVRRAECRLETSQGIVESDVETHLGEIAEALKQPE